MTYNCSNHEASHTYSKTCSTEVFPGQDESFFQNDVYNASFSCINSDAFTTEENIPTEYNLTDSVLVAQQKLMKRLLCQMIVLLVTR